MLEDLKVKLLKYEIVKEFLADLKNNFGRRDEESVKVIELKILEQEEKTIEEFI